LKANANEMTPVRQAQWERLIGLRAGNNAAFQRENIEALDLPWSVKKEMLRAQATDRKSAAAVTARTNTLNTLLHFESVQQAMFPIFGGSKSSPEYEQFTGAFYQEAEEWQKANPGKRIDENTVHGIAAR